jgi:hypothetical protein
MSKKMRTWRIIFVMALLAVVMVTFAPAGFAQCAMCKATLTGSNNAVFIRNLNIGVLVLLVPPVTIFCSIFVILKRHKDQDKANDA